MGHPVVIFERQGCQSMWLMAALVQAKLDKDNIFIIEYPERLEQVVGPETSVLYLGRDWGKSDNLINKIISLKAQYPKCLVLGMNAQDLIRYNGPCDYILGPGAEDYYSNMAEFISGKVSGDKGLLEEPQKSAS